MPGLEPTSSPSAALDIRNTQENVIQFHNFVVGFKQQPFLQLVKASMEGAKLNFILFIQTSKAESQRLTKWWWQATKSKINKIRNNTTIVYCNSKCTVDVRVML